jgi:hypothetical protein
MPRFTLRAVAALVSLSVFLMVICTTAAHSFFPSRLREQTDFQESNGKATTQPKVVLEPVTGYSSTYTTTINLTNGAHVKPILGTGPLDVGTNGCRGWVNRFEALNVAGFTQKSAASTASVVVSGSFHDDNGRPAFPQRVNSWRATYGFACSAAEGVNDMLMLTIRDQEKRAYISPFSLTTFNSTSIAPDVVVGLKPSFPKSPTTRTGRNYVGLANPYNQGFGTIIFLTSASLTQSEAVTILKSKGCPEDQIMQLDGSTVAQLSKKNANGTWSHLITSSTRKMPQAFLIEG